MTDSQHSFFNLYNPNEYNLNFGMTPAQFHAGLDKLWEALELDGVQEHDIFTLAAERIKQQEEVIRQLEENISNLAKRINFEEYSPNR